MGKLNKSMDDFEEWFTKKIEEQLAKPLTEEPAFRVDEIKTRVEKLSDQVKKIAVRPKPAEKPKKKKKKKKDKKSNETETANATDTSEAESQSEAENQSEAESQT